MSNGFTPEQQRYLEGLVAGVSAVAGGPAAAEPTGPDAAHLIAMKKAEAEGGKLADPEKFKRQEHPFDAYQRMKSQAAQGEYPAPQDNFRWRFYGLFYVAPNQNSYMCRLRMPNGILTHWQMAGLGRLAESHGGGYAHVTTRANLQIREIEAVNAVSMIEAILDLGLCTRGSGADNIRNVTGTPTAGIDPQELLDTRPYTRDWHFHILNDRSLYGLPRKFNVAFDGGGKVGALEDTNDIGFQAVEVSDGAGVEPGVWFRVAIGGITGHKDFARDTGILVRPQEATFLADAIVRVFIDHGNRTDRTKARLKYLLDAWGLEKFLEAVEQKLGRPLDRIEARQIKEHVPPDRMAHLGVHPQKQPGLNWIGVVLPSGKLTAQQMRGLADVAGRLGDGDIRLTVWQNLILSGVADDKVPAVVQAIDDLGLSTRATSIRAGLVSCTGNVGCKFSASDTKGTAELIATHIESRFDLDQPINIHLTGCHHSCAQHHISDIGLLACKIAKGEGVEPVEGFHIYVGGGFGANATIGREIWRDVENADCPAAIEKLLKAYLAYRSNPNESFFEFANRYPVETLLNLAEDKAA
ncbi:MAG: NirA family protein [Rhodospirillales bacterium]|nr:NirA family protein [Rhodospirillales bacterium]